MAFENPPFATQAGSFSAEQTRRAMFSWAARTAANTPGIVTGGLISATDCQLSPPGSGMTVNVGTGELIVGGNEGGTQGAYNCRITSTTNLAIAAASSSKPRIDLVCGTINDAQYTTPSGGVTSGQWAPIVVTGTPTTGATLSNLSGAPALPGSSLLLGYVLVPISATSIITADILNVATVALPQFSTSFLQLLTATKLRVAYGSANATFAASSFETGTITIPHGLGSVPVYASGFFSQNGSSTSAFVVQQTATPDNTNLYFYGWCSATVGSSTTIPISWIALG